MCGGNGGKALQGRIGKRRALWKNTRSHSVLHTHVEERGLKALRKHMGRLRVRQERAQAGQCGMPRKRCPMSIRLRSLANRRRLTTDCGQLSANCRTFLPPTAALNEKRNISVLKDGPVPGGVSMSGAVAGRGAGHSFNPPKTHTESEEYYRRHGRDPNGAEAALGSRGRLSHSQKCIS